MSKKYLINIVRGDSNVGFNAVVKPRKDVETTLERNGYSVINIPYVTDYPAWKRFPLHFIQIIKAVKKLRDIKPKEIIIQYPGMRVGSKSIALITKLLHNENITILVHDIDSLRIQGEISVREAATLNRVKKVIVHTDNMRTYLNEHGVSTEMKTLWLFDYYAKDSIHNTVEINDKTVVFAGNLKKSEFLRFIDFSLEGIRFCLYGLPIDFNLPKGLEYKGRFAPDYISQIEGAWGLVWDGDSVDTCNGKMGNYLKYNSSHKAALYIASGKPVIVWDKSGLAPFIIKNKLGISISTLRELPSRLSRISDREYTEYIESVRVFQTKLLNGKMLEDVLAQ